MSETRNTIINKNGLKFAIIFTALYFIIGALGISIVDIFIITHREWVFLLITTMIMFFIALQFIYRAHEQIRLLVDQKYELNIYKSIFEQMHEGLVITNEKEEIVAVNPSFTVTTGYREDEVYGKKPSLLSSGIHSNEFYANMKKELKIYGRWQGEIINQRKNGQVYPEQLSISEIRNKDGVITNYIGVFTDISFQHQAEGKIEFLTHYDTSTKLPKFNMFMEQLNNFIKSRKSDDEGFSLFIVDISKLKTLNATYGHKIVDELLHTLAIRLQSIYRGLTMGRLNSKEFAIILPTLYEIKAIKEEAETLIQQIESPIHYKGDDYFLSATIGIGLYPNHGMTADELYKKATLAKTTAKEVGFKYQVFGEKLLSNVQRKVILEKHLIRAIENKEFKIYYQPQIDIKENKVVGLEALIRWNHESLGMITPTEFIPLAEESDLIVSIGEWVLETVCYQVKTWYQSGVIIPKIAVNLSPKQFQNPDLLRKTKEIVSKSNIDPILIEFEITENISLFKTEAIINTIHSLKSLGFKISIDDFGTGHSNLSYLQKLPIDHIKIDRSFIHDIPENKNSIALTKAIIAMAHELHISVIAEGVETIEQLQFLQKHHCEIVQGYYYSEAIAADEVTNLLESLENSFQLKLGIE
ncbi:putative bifunctional diguanylate cyclase/phosphodiesterase [Calidifontibacillus oryziterrae]|uniref:putative bifunctional diguanylate cyclase/phosphodiesterase n=1 Tax=Calidifontibacillus oryziterrae TaxID=1191699 RepID=UPI0003043BB7|nr:EAL domain-containing protein [Calidifontibacillus oryziterrae]